MLGDNAYNDGTDSEYQSAVFDMYPSILRNTVLWSTLGNHDGHTADSATQSGPYYDIFTLPVSGESGGVASGTEAYYSFDYANIHFVCLDSYESDRSLSGAMAAWVQSDLAATTQEWIIAFWHHPPYTKGSHNSDTEARLIEMRQTFNPIFESYGVDLVLGGHSHSYERSMLIDGHYGSSGTFGSGNVVDAGNGNPAGDGGYLKLPQANDGAVYAVAGSSGKISGGSLNHPAMITNLNELGSLVIDVFANQMDVQFINGAGIVRDPFRITHDPGTTNPPAAPSGLAVTTVSDSELALAWTDNATDESSQSIERSPDGNSWGVIASVAPNITAYIDTGLNDDTTYHYRVQASNSAGSSSYSNVAQGTTDQAPPFVDHLASGETFGLGTVSGTFANTHEFDGTIQSITETESGGKPSNRRSQLQHTWNFTVTPGNTVTVHANAWSSGSTFDDFLFEASTDNGNNWMPLFVVSSTDPNNTEQASLPSSTSGGVLVKVTDTDRTKGERTLDTVSLDELYIQTESQPGTPPAAPTSLTASAISAGEIQLGWTDNANDELGFEIERRESSGAWLFLTSVGTDVVIYSDIAVVPNTTYSYRVRAFSGSGTSAFTNEATNTTPNGIALAASGYKMKGKHTIDLTWSGASGTNVDIFRDGALIDTVTNSGAHTDNTGQKGGAVYVYKVCEVGSTTVCSSIATVTF